MNVPLGFFLLGLLPGIVYALTMKGRLDEIMSHLNELRSAVAANTAVIESAITFIRGLADQIEHHLGDEAALTEIVAELRAKDQALADAIATPPPPTP